MEMMIVTMIVMMVMVTVIESCPGPPNNRSTWNPKLPDTWSRYLPLGGDIEEPAVGGMKGKGAKVCAEGRQAVQPAAR